MGVFCILQTQAPVSELDLVLGVALGNPHPFHPQRNFTKQEKTLSEVVIQLWTNFARAG